MHEETEKKSKNSAVSVRQIPPDGCPVRVNFQVGRPFGTRMETNEPLSVLRPYLSRHFGVAEAEQLLLWGNREIDDKLTVSGNGLRTATDGIVHLNLTSLNKRKVYLQAKLPSGKVTVFGVEPSSSMLDIKQLLCSREDTELSGEDPMSLRLMCNYNELQDDATVGYFRIQTGQTVIVMTRPRNSRKQLPSRSAERISICVEDANGQEHVVQLDLSEPISTLRSLMSSDDSVYTDIFVDGQRIVDENVSFKSLGLDRSASIQFVMRKHKMKLSPTKRLQGGPAGPRRCISIDLEGVDGHVQRVDIDADEPVSTLRSLADADRHCSIFFNGRMIKNESRTFTDIDAANGSHFQFRNQGLSSERSLDPSQKDLANARSRVTESLQSQILELQQQLDAARIGHERERMLTTRIADLEREVEDTHRRYQGALERIRELESTVERQYRLLKRSLDVAVEPSTTPAMFDQTYSSFPPVPPPKFRDTYVDSVFGHSRRY
jgi:hypothetical protein